MGGDLIKPLILQLRTLKNQSITSIAGEKTFLINWNNIFGIINYTLMGDLQFKIILMYTYDSVEISRISKILRNMVTDLEVYCVKVG